MAILNLHDIIRVFILQKRHPSLGRHIGSLIVASLRSQTSRIAGFRIRVLFRLKLFNKSHLWAVLRQSLIIASTPNKTQTKVKEALKNMPPLGLNLRNKSVN
ncbi:uncharacterized protein LOC120334421 isoform X2 [Styela clava]